MTRREPTLTPRGTAAAANSGLFGRMFPHLKPLLPPDSALAELAAAMIDASPGDPAGDNPAIDAGFTYLGQFIDHDITLDVTSISEVVDDPSAVFNFRTPALELDSLYGLGPAVSPFMYERDSPRLLIGETVKGGLDPLPPAPNDLPRSKTGLAIIGDARNDENLLVAQTHLLFMKFHNAVCDQGRSFDEARQTVLWHYQWIVLHDFVRRLVDPKILDRVLEKGRRFYEFRKTPFMPLEFSAAAYRLGHSMVRESYDHNRVFTSASLQLLFEFTGLSGNLGRPGTGPSNRPQLPTDWIIDWRRFYDGVPNGGGSAFTLNKARMLDPLLVPKLHSLPGGASLPLLNLLRGKKMQLPSGQRVAKAMKIKPLTPAQMGAGPDGAVAARHGFDVHAPLWYYILKEAQVEGKGRRLGPVGSTIVAEVFVGLLEGDPASFLSQDPDWVPTLGKDGKFGMADLIAFVNDINPVG